jgi:hypothetical protein
MTSEEDSFSSLFRSCLGFRSSSSLKCLLTFACAILLLWLFSFRVFSDGVHFSSASSSSSADSDITLRNARLVAPLSADSSEQDVSLEADQLSPRLRPKQQSQQHPFILPPKAAADMNRFPLMYFPSNSAEVLCKVPAFNESSIVWEPAPPTKCESLAFSHITDDGRLVIDRCDGRAFVVLTSGLLNGEEKRPLHPELRLGDYEQALVECKLSDSQSFLDFHLHNAFNELAFQRALRFSSNQPVTPGSVYKRKT